MRGLGSGTLLDASNTVSPYLNTPRSSSASIWRYNPQHFTPASERSASGTVSKNGLAFLVDELHLERRAVIRVNQMQGQSPRQQNTE